jgi:hypothetical protein
MSGCAQRIVTFLRCWVSSFELCTVRKAHNRVIVHVKHTGSPRWCLAACGCPTFDPVLAKNAIHTTNPLACAIFPLLYHRATRCVLYHLLSNNATFRSSRCPCLLRLLHPPYCYGTMHREVRPAWSTPSHHPAAALQPLTACQLSAVNLHRGADPPSAREIFKDNNGSRRFRDLQTPKNQVLWAEEATCRGPRIRAPQTSLQHTFDVILTNTPGLPVAGTPGDTHEAIFASHMVSHHGKHFSEVDAGAETADEACIVCATTKSERCHWLG